MKAWKVVACIGVGGVCVMTGGLAVPAVGLIAGTTGIGVTGLAVATGSIAALSSKTIIKNRKTIIATLRRTLDKVTKTVVFSISELLEAREHNKELRNILQEMNLDNVTKQKVIIELNMQVEKLRIALIEEKNRADKSNERIMIIEEQLTDILDTLIIAQES